MKERKLYIDILRFLGISFVILAHVHPPQWLFNIRLFDVVLLVFVSGLLYTGRDPKFSVSQIVNRSLRLLIPLYVFLTVFFLISVIIRPVVEIDLSTNIMIGSYFLSGGLLGTWVFRVFLMQSVMTPLLLKLSSSVKSNFLYLLSCIASISILNCLITMGLGAGNKIIENIFYAIVGYSAVFLVALRANALSKKALLTWIAIFSILTISLSSLNLLEGKTWIESAMLMKYPPHAIYLFYGLTVSLILLLLLKSINRCPLLFTVIGQNSNWVYLYHIMFIYFVETLHLTWWLEYIIVYLLAVGSVFVQVTIVNKRVYEENCKYLKFFQG